MCVIAIQKPFTRKPSVLELQAMWNHNPDGAGFMVNRSGLVHIHKGFMTFRSFIEALRSEHITRYDTVVYHFRISTQAGKTPFMTHPFPLTDSLSDCESLDISCGLGIAHNGIIPVTSDPTELNYSDTALFITEYLSQLIRTRSDLEDPRIIRIIKRFTGFSRFALMDGTGRVWTIGDFVNDNGLLISNTFHKEVTLK